MKKSSYKYSYIGISFVILLFGIWVIPKVTNKIKKQNLMKFQKVPEYSFTNQDGKIISNKDMEGKVYVLEFFFTSCTTICPVMNKNMINIQNKYYGNPNFGLISITIDPNRDTIEKLKTYTKNIGVVHNNWHFLTGSKDDIYNLSITGFNLYTGENKSAQGGFEHSGLFALIDKQGYIRSRVVKEGGFENPLKFYDGTDLSHIKMLKEDINILLKDN